MEEPFEGARLVLRHATPNHTQTHGDFSQVRAGSGMRGAGESRIDGCPVR